jgi:glycyl-tRNA synthetase
MATIEEITSLSKRRGFVYPTSELYGGIGGFYDFGPLGVELSRNIKNYWWKTMVSDRDDIVGLDSSIIYNPEVWVASGHVASFTDPLIECKICHERFRADQPDEIEAHVKKHRGNGVKEVDWTEPRQFNLLFKTFVGPVEDSKSQAYLRGETCQGIYINFPNIVSTSRVKVPFGIAQIGKAFRNEVTPGKFLFRVREFEQMEMEYFVHPKDAEKSLEYWKNESWKWILSLGISENHLRFRQHEANERAHYAADSWDIEYDYPDWGFKELQGIANRTDYDLKTHSQYSGKDLSYRDPATGEIFIPYIIEPSISIQRIMLAILFDAYTKEEKRVVLKLNPQIAPYKAAIFPLLPNKPELVSTAKNIYLNLKKNFMVSWDDRGNIGKRYMAQDEAGTPWCITVDFQTLSDKTVTVRDRDSMKQERITLDNLEKYIQTNNINAGGMI